MSACEPGAAGQPPVAPTWSWSPRGTDALLTGATLLLGLAMSLDLAGHVELEATHALLRSTAALALPFRRRWPVPVLLFTLLVMLPVHEGLEIPVLVALFTLAEGPYTRRQLGGAVVLYAVMTNIPQYHGVAEEVSALVDTLLSAISACGAVALGRLLQTRRRLMRSLAELREAQEHQRELHAQAVLARERAQLAREMHDVVSHQVSLIAVRAGSLQVGADGDETREAARTIRKLSVSTLDELRHMVTLLRAAGGRDTEITPQLTRHQLSDLVSGSGLDARLAGEVPDDASPAVQRAVYRIVQEALTNVRKHAPGAGAVVGIHPVGPGLEITVVNTPATRPGLRLPGSRHGLVGLRERAENLHGTLVAGATPDGGYRVHALLPDRRH